MINLGTTTTISGIAISKPINVFCPVCNRGKIIIEDEDAEDGELQIIMPGSSKKAKWYVKCPACKHQVGFSVEPR